MSRSVSLAAAFALCALLGACASTKVEISGTAPKASLCQAAGEHVIALVLWGPRWRPDQKDVPLREAAAEQGIKAFFAQSDCYATVDVRRASLERSMSIEQLRLLAAETSPKPDRVLTITVRELGPIVKLLSSLALVEGGTDVVLNITSLDGTNPNSRLDFTVHWQHGGPGVLKGTKTLADDIQSVLTVALMPSARR